MANEMSQFQIRIIEHKNKYKVLISSNRLRYEDKVFMFKFKLLALNFKDHLGTVDPIKCRQSLEMMGCLQIDKFDV